MSLMRRFYRYFIFLLVFVLTVEIYGYVLLKRELDYLSDTVNLSNENYRELSRLTKALLQGNEVPEGAAEEAISRDEWLVAWQTYDEGISELGTKEFQFLLSNQIKQRKDNILLFWYSSRITFERAVSTIIQYLPAQPDENTEVGVYHLLDKAKLNGDRLSIIHLSELISNLVSFDVFAKEIMQIEMLLLSREIDEHVERLKYYFWLQFSIVCFVFLLLSILLIFTRDPSHPSVKRRQNQNKKQSKKANRSKRSPPRMLNENRKL